MSRSLLLPKPLAYLYRAKALLGLPIILSFFLLAPSAQAQGYWTPTPCDAQGNTVDAQGNPILGFSSPSDNAGFYAMIGTEQGTATSSYPIPMINASIADPSDYRWNLLHACGLAGPPSIVYPNTILLPDGIGAYTPYCHDPYTANGIPNYAQAQNFFDDSTFWYNVPTLFNPKANYVSGYVNGAVDAKLTGTLVYRVKEVWYGNPPFNPPPTAANPMPTSITLLLRTTLKASATASYTNSSSTKNLSGYGSASDAPFNELVVAKAGDAGGPGSPPPVVGYHLVTVGVDPKTGIAEYDVSGTVEMSGSNSVQYGIMPSATQSWPTTTNGPATAGATASVAAAFKSDNRAVTLSRDGARSHGKVYSPDGQLHGEYVDASGVEHGETTYSTNLTPNWQIFHPIFVGAWLQKTGYDNLGQPSGTVPDVTWAWSPKESEDTWYIGKCEMPNSSITYNTNGTSSGKSAGSVVYPVGYAAMDNGDHATATASYALAVHDQWDNLRLDPSHPFDVVDNISVVQLNGVNYPPQINPDYTISSPVGPLTLSVTIGTQFSAQLNGSFKLSDFFTLGGNFTATASVSFAANQTITGPPIPPRCYIQLTSEVHYHKNHWFVDHYLTSGYDNTYMQLIDAKGADALVYWGHPLQLAGSGLGGA